MRASVSILALALALGGCATTPEGPPGPRDGVYEGVAPAQGACGPAVLTFTVEHGRVEGRVQGFEGGSVSGSIDPADGTGFIKLHGQFSTLKVRPDGFEATLTTPCGRRRAEGRKAEGRPGSG